MRALYHPGSGSNCFDFFRIRFDDTGRIRLVAFRFGYLGRGSPVRSGMGSFLLHHGLYGRYDDLGRQRCISGQNSGLHDRRRRTIALCSIGLEQYGDGERHYRYGDADGFWDNKQHVVGGSGFQPRCFFRGWLGNHHDRIRSDRHDRATAGE